MYDMNDKEGRRIPAERRSQGGQPLPPCTTTPKCLNLRPLWEPLRLDSVLVVWFCDDAHLFLGFWFVLFVSGWFVLLFGVVWVAFSSADLLPGSSSVFFCGAAWLFVVISADSAGLALTLTRCEPGLALLL